MDKTVENEMATGIIQGSEHPYDYKVYSRHPLHFLYKEPRTITLVT